MSDEREMLSGFFSRESRLAGRKVK
jgi:hypothetical protein